MPRLVLVALPVLFLLTLGTQPALSNIEDFTTWTLVEDPPHPGLDASVISPSEVFLTANGAIPAATDIGFQSVDGSDVMNSTSGFYFSKDADFEIAVDFSVSTENSLGLAGIGFGIGEDGDGANSAGVGLAIANGAAFAFSGAARINDVTQAPMPIGAAATLAGRFFVSYDSNNGDVTVGVNSTIGAASPSSTTVFTGIQNSWTDKDLLVSLFLRSDSFIVPPLSAGTVDTQFLSVTVLQGTATSVVPEPAMGSGFLLGGLLLLAARRRR